jgi:hypothetical protein
MKLSIEQRARLEEARLRQRETKKRIEAIAKESKAMSEPKKIPKIDPFEGDTRAKLAQTIAILADMVHDRALGAYDHDYAERADLALDCAGWALCALEECEEGEDLGLVCERLIGRHNAAVRAKKAGAS